MRSSIYKSSVWDKNALEIFKNTFFYRTPLVAGSAFVFKYCSLKIIFDDKISVLLYLICFLYDCKINIVVLNGTDLHNRETLFYNIHKVQTVTPKNLLLEFSQNSQENTCVGVSFLIKLQASGDCFCKEHLKLNFERFILVVTE